MENQVESPNKTYKTLFYVLITILLMVGSFAIGMLCQKTLSPKKADDKIKTEVKAGPSVKPSVTTKVETTPKVEPTTSGLSAQEEELPAIRAAMAAKYNKQTSEVDLTISKFEPGFAQGGVQFSGEMGGGWFLAAEVGGQWVIVDDGNGTISCDIIALYNFPTTIVSECWDETSQDIIYR